MTTTLIEQLYAAHIKLLAPEEQLRLVAIITSALAQGTPQAARRKRSILELEGVGAEIWHGIDAQAYVKELRDEWDKGAA